MRKSRYRMSSTAVWTSVGTAGSMAASRCVNGIDEMTLSQGNSLPSAWTATARPPSWRIRLTGASMRTSEPWARTFSVQRSHIIPGPNFGYSNSSMRLAISFWFRLGRTAFMTALNSDRFLMRCAAQSAGISSAGMPHTFSV